MFAVVFIPNFSLQAVLRHEPELRKRAVALIDPELSKPGIIQLTASARACRVCEGLTACQAMARCGNLLIKTRSLTQEQSATEVLLQTAYAFSPNIESTAPGVCTMELKGLPVAAVYDRQSENGDAHRAPLQDWAEKIFRCLAQFYLEAQIGFAATPALALLAARMAKPVLTLNHAMAGEFPIEVLEPSPEIFAILQRWGIRTIGEFLALGKNEVVERLGPTATELFNRVSAE